MNADTIEIELQLACGFCQRPRGTMLRNDLIVRMILIWSLASCVVGCGGFNSTSQKEYRYSNGNLQRQDTVSADETVLSSTWYTVEGDILMRSSFINGNGSEIYLNDNGTVRRTVSYQNGKLHGIDVAFGHDGTIEKVVLWNDGTQVKSTLWNPGAATGSDVE
jgi:hypothetical protein